MNYFDLFWIFLLFLAFLPYFKQKMMEGARLRLMRDLEKQRGSRVIILIHRQESMSFLGIPLVKFIDINDSEQVLRAIRLTPDEMPIDMILHTPGGLVLAAEQIARALRGHKGKVTVFVPHDAMSGGTLIALSADEIVMDENAVLGPLDPQIGGYPAVSIIKAAQQKEPKDLDDKTLILKDISEKALVQMRSFVENILKEKLGQRAGEIAERLTGGTWTHDYPITVEELKAMGIEVSTDMPQLVYNLMELFPQPIQNRPSVQFIPLPYEGAPRKVEK